MSVEIGGRGLGFSRSLADIGCRPSVELLEVKAGLGLGAYR